MINRIFFEGRCLVEKKGCLIYSDNPAGKFPICIATFLNTTRLVKISKTFLFLNDLAVYAKQNFAKNKFYILEASFQKLSGTRHIYDKENPNYWGLLKGESLIVHKIYRSYRTYVAEETTEIEKNLKFTNKHTYQTSDWEMLAKREPLKILTKDTIKKALENLGVYELNDN